MSRGQRLAWVVGAVVAIACGPVRGPEHDPTLDDPRAPYMILHPLPETVGGPESPDAVREGRRLFAVAVELYTDGMFRVAALRFVEAARVFGDESLQAGVACANAARAWVTANAALEAEVAAERMASTEPVCARAIRRELERR